MIEAQFRDGVLEVSPYSAGLSVSAVNSQFGIERVVKLGSNENAFGSAVDLNALSDVDLARYPDLKNSGLMGAISSFYGVDQDRIMVGNGSDELIFMLAQMFLNEGDEVLSSEATFSFYRIVTTLMKGRFKQVPLLDNVIDLSGILNAVSEQTKLIFIANPNSPTGTYFREDVLRDFLDQLDPRVIVVLDEAYFEYVMAEDYPDSVALMQDYSNLVVLRTFSKIYGLAALRVGYGFANETITDYFYRLRAPFSVNSVALEGARLALENQMFVRDCREKTLAGKQVLYRLFDDLGIFYLESEGNFVYFEIPEAKSVFEKLLSRGVVIRHLASFGRDRGLRVTIGTEEEMDIFVTALKEVL